MPIRPRSGRSSTWRQRKSWSSSSAGRLEASDLAALGVDPGQHVLDRAVLAGRIHRLEDAAAPPSGPARRACPAGSRALGALDAAGRRRHPCRGRGRRYRPDRGPSGGSPCRSRSGIAPPACDVASAPWRQSPYPAVIRADRSADQPIVLSRNSRPSVTPPRTITLWARRRRRRGEQTRPPSPPARPGSSPAPMNSPRGPSHRRRCAAKGRG